MPRPIVLQPYYNIMNRAPELEVLPAAHHYGLGIVPYSPIARGILSGKYTPDAEPPESSRAGRADRRMMNSEWRPESIEIAQKLKDHAEARGKSLVHFAVAWVLNNQSISAAIAGPRTFEQWESYLGALDYEWSEERRGPCRFPGATGPPLDTRLHRSAISGPRPFLLGNASRRRLTGMKMAGATLAVIALAVLTTGPAKAKADDKKLRNGAYQVKVGLDLPNVENTGAGKTTTLCVTSSETYGLAVLSDNNPLAACPVTNIRQSIDRLTFDIICEGPNAARGQRKLYARLRTLPGPHSHEYGRQEHDDDRNPKRPPHWRMRSGQPALADHAGPLNLTSFSSC